MHLGERATQPGLTPVHAALRHVPMFRGVSTADLLALAKSARIKTYARGARLWNEGDAAETLTVILAGHVKVQRCRALSGVILKLYGPGDPVGSVAVHTGIPYPATAACVEPVTLLEIPRHAYFALLDRHPEFARAIIAELTQISLSLAKRLEDYRELKVDSRIAQLFLTLADAAGGAGGDTTEIRLRLTRTEIAGLVGTTLETASRIMSRWARAGIVLPRRGGFLLSSRAALQRILDEAGR